MKKILIALLFLSFFFPKPAFAHAFGTQYTLPIPFYLYFYGSAIALIVSFIIIGFFFNQTKKDLSYPKIDISHKVFEKTIFSEWFVFLVKVWSFSLFILTVITGLFGVNNFEFNFNMTFFWVIFLLGMTYATAIFGNIYAVFNPWNSCIEFLEYIWNGKIKGFLPYPKKLGYYPALIFYFLLVWFELVGVTTPHKLAVILLSYTAIIFLGVFVFGKQAWFEKAELFSVFFSLLGNISPLVYQAKKLYLRPPFVGLLSEITTSFSLLLFILFMLASTAFDGFRETTSWGNFSSFLSHALKPIFGNSVSSFIDTVCLLLSPFLFLAIYIAALLIMKIFVKSTLSLKSLAYKFAFSLIPIALVYNISHYYTLLVIQGQDIIRLASDPFGFNWNLLHTNNFTPNISILNTQLIWQTEVAFLLGGHIVAVYLSHMIALHVYPSHKKAVASQFPMLFLMVIYTVLGLWILSQPLSVGK